MRDIKKEHYDKFIETSRILDWVGADENIIKHVYYEAFKDGEATSEEEPKLEWIEGTYKRWKLEADTEIGKRLWENFVLQTTSPEVVRSQDLFPDWLKEEK